MKKTKKLLSLYLSVMLVLSAIFVPVGAGFTAFAEEAVSKVAIAKKELTTSDLFGNNPWTSMLATANSETGGIKFTYTGGFRSVRLGIKDGASLDGMYLKMNNITKTGGNVDPKIMFVFSPSHMYYLSGQYGADVKEGMFALLLDTQNGALKVVRDPNLTGAAEKEDTIISNDNLKYDYVQGKVVTIRSFKNDNNGYDISLYIGEDEAITGEITAEIMAKSTAFAGCDVPVITVHAGAAQSSAADYLSMSFDLVEYCNIPAATGDETVEKVEIAKKELTVSDIAGKNDWVYGYSTEASPTGGVRFSFLNAFLNMRQGIADHISLDGLYLKLNNITSVNSVTPNILFVFGPSFMGYAQAVYNNMFALQLDTGAGALKVVRDNLSGGNEDVIIQNDSLKYDYIKGKVVLIRSFKNENGGYDISVKIGSDAEITGTITSEIMAKSTAFTVHDAAYITVHPAVNQSACANSVYNCYMSAKFDIVECCTIDETEVEQEPVAITKKALTTADIAGTNHWPAMLDTEDSATGGIKFSFLGAFRNIRLGVNDAASLDGMYLKLNNITSINNAVPRLMFVFSGTKADQTRDGMFALLLDTNSGKLKVVRDAHLLSQTGRSQDVNYLQHEDLIIESDNLKYDHIKGKVVIIRTYLNADGGYDLTVKIGNDNELTGTLTADIMAKSTAFNAKHIMYLSLHAGVCQDMSADYASMSVDVVEYCTVPKTIGDKVAIEGKELTVSNVAGTNHWQSMIATENSLNGGVKFTFVNSFTNIRLGFDEVASLDGMYLKINNITKLSNIDPRILFIFSASQWAESADGMFGLSLDTSSGVLKVVREKYLTGAADKEDIIIANDKLKYANIAGKVVVIRTFDDRQGGFNVSIQIGDDEAITGNISAEVMAKSTAFIDYDNAYITVTSGVPQNDSANYTTMSFDVVEYWSAQMAVEGDLNGDGELNASDLTSLRKYLIGIEDGSLDESLADLNNDGNVDIIDLVVLKKTSLNWPR